MATTVEAYIDHPVAFQVWEQNLRPMILKGQGLRRMLGDSILDGNITTLAGVHLPDRKGMRFKKSRIVRVVERIIRGLLWHHYGTKPSERSVFEVYRNPNFNDQIADLINSMTQLSSIGDDIFRYRHALIDGDPDGSVWCLQFYNYSEWLTIVSGNTGASSSCKLGASAS